ncbi:hypothetical protein PVAP13_6KG214306 [Panicum virgatum]|uniref:Uncharacterized protein n=1 Tax=Panicum virgatum TaxID=38727 RepID=A0A8T0RD69_PANVG|nr:hypothetical protein PVAP13_6KG214306 [Panicum virgatum]
MLTSSEVVYIVSDPLLIDNDKINPTCNLLRARWSRSIVAHAWPALTPCMGNWRSSGRSLRMDTVVTFF